MGYELMPVSLKDQVALVIGASSGIGRETAIQLARDGAKVMASARRIERLRELKDGLAAEGLAVEVHAADAKDPAAMGSSPKLLAGSWGLSTSWCMPPGPTRRTAPSGA
jgi:NADP-dependent 3-hydroxy acid dehydrogenase YdfG